MKYLFLFITSFAIAQQTQYVDFRSVLGKVTFDVNEKSISGYVYYDFDVLKPIDTIKIDAQQMTFYNVKLNGRPIPYNNTGKELQLIFPFRKLKNTVSFEYKAFPKQALYFLGDFDKSGNSKISSQIWTQGQGKYTSNWFPSFDDVNEKVIFNLNISFHKNYQVISNGILESQLEQNDLKIWNYSMQKPMSSYLLMLAIGKYKVRHEKSKSGIPLAMYFEPKDSALFEPTYRYSKKMFDYIEKEIGVKYPWNNYKQVPVQDFLYAGMENTSSTLFSSRYIVDSIGFEDRSYTSVNAHELAHQWFGDLVTASNEKHHWLQEGFATYYELLAQRKINGDDYFYSKMYESAQQIKYASRTDTIPVLNAKASSLTFYQKGAWALFVLHEAIGDKAFKKAVCSYLKKNAFQTVTTQDFFNEIKKVSSYDLKNFSEVWLESSLFNSQEANDLLNKNKTIRLLFEVEKLKETPLIEKEVFLSQILKSNAHYSVKKAVVNQLKKEAFNAKKELLQLALNTKNVKVRQAVALTLPKIPLDFRIQYESLLEDKSYVTKEFALYYLWKNFPEYREKYLNFSKDWIGFNDYNLKIAWLYLALSTPNYFSDQSILANELMNYSSPNYEAITRQNALEKLIALQYTNESILKNIVSATTHHMWQFSKFGRDTIRKLLQNETIRTSFESILPDLDEKGQMQLNRLLKE